VAFEVQRSLVDRGWLIRDLAKALDKDETWLQRKLFGHVPADLGELLEWAVECGSAVLPEINGPEDIVPNGSNRKVGHLDSGNLSEQVDSIVVSR
jgi:hypothetical protein